MVQTKLKTSHPIQPKPTSHLKTTIKTQKSIINSFSIKTPMSKESCSKKTPFSTTIKQKSLTIQSRNLHKRQTLHLRKPILLHSNVIRETTTNLSGKRNVLLHANNIKTSTKHTLPFINLHQVSCCVVTSQQQQHQQQNQLSKTVGKQIESTRKGKKIHEKLCISGEILEFSFLLFGFFQLFLQS